jgi:hypothetical protein
MPQPMPGMWVTSGPPPRPPRRYRAWPWLLTLVLVFGGLCYGGYLVVKANTTDPLTEELTITIDDLAPTGLHQAIVTSSWAHAVGQHTDGTVEVASVRHGTDTTVRHRSTKGGGWTVAFQVGDWVAVIAAPAADGTRTMLVSNAASNTFAETALGAGEKVTLTGVDPGGGLGYIAYAEPANTVRYGVIGGPTPVPGQPFRLPAGARPLPGEQGDDHLDVIDGAGKISRYTRKGLQEGLGQAAPGHPVALVHYDALAGNLYVAENKTEYQLLRNGTRIYVDQSIRRPVWIGPCGDKVCMIDEITDDPTSRQLFEITEAGPSDTRAQVPYAAVPASLPRAAEFVILPTLENDKAGSAVANLKKGTFNRNYYDVRLRDDPKLSGDVDAVLLPTRPAGAAAEWAGTAQPLAIEGVNFGDGASTDLGTVTAIPASCDVGGSRLACATATDFRVWTIDS